MRSTSAIRNVTRFSRTIAQDAIISDTTSPVPSRLAMRRNGRSVTPDMGARMTGVSIVTRLSSRMGARGALRRDAVWSVFAQHLGKLPPAARFAIFTRAAPANYGNSVAVLTRCGPARIGAAMRIAALLVAGGTGSRSAATNPSNIRRWPANPSSATPPRR